MNYTNTLTGKVSYGAPIVYTLSILNNAVNINNAINYVYYLRSLENSADLIREGLLTYPSASFYGNVSAVPALLRNQQVQLS